ncbi:MAG TPA: acyl carrier protein [Candidatus Angelobacter sp.]
MNEIKTQLRSIIVQALHLNQGPETIPDTNLTSALGLDSINSLELLIWVENHFHISIADEDLSVSLIDSLDVLAEYVERQLNLQSVGAAAGGEA